MRRMLLCLVGLMMALCLWGCASQKPNTETTYPEDKKIFGVSVAGMTKTEGRAAVREKVDSYTLRVIIGENETVFSGEELGLTYKSGKISVEADETLLDKIPDLPKDENVGAEKAYIIYNDTEQRFQAVNGSERQHWDYEKLLSDILTAAKKGKKKVTLELSQVTIPGQLATRSPELVHTAARANALLDTPWRILFTLPDSDETVTETPDRGIVAGWIAIDGKNLTVRRENVLAYCESLREAHDAIGSGGTYFPATSGEQVLIRDGSGWKLDTAAMAETIGEIITGDSEPVVEALYIPGWGEPRYDNFNGCYVEADLTNQMVYMYYMDELLVETPCVSGCPAKGNATPTGVFWIFERFTDAKLFGETQISYVDYWMGFSGQCGFHDASWRTTYGGDRYLFHGSHGCINLPFGAAQELFFLVYEGLPVIVHGGVSELHAAQITQQPQSVTRTEGKHVKFTVEAEYAEKYQWYYWHPGAEKWVKSTAEGADTPTLRVKATEKTATYVYRCRITGENGEKIYTDAVRIKLKK